MRQTAALVIGVLITVIITSECWSKGCVDALSEDPKVAEIISCMKELSESIKSLENVKSVEAAKKDYSIFPTGTVVILNKATGCPSGWEDLGDNWPGHVLVAAHGDSEDKERQFSFQHTGGEKEFYLQLSEMPVHEHDVVALNYNNPGDTENKTRGIPLTGNLGDGINTRNDGATLIQVMRMSTVYKSEQSERHNNMPPYRALYFCVSP